MPSAANLSYYLDIVLEKYLLRKMIQTCTGSRRAGFLITKGEVDALLDEVERDILRISEDAGRRRQTDKIKELVNKAITTIEEYHQQPGDADRHRHRVSRISTR